MIEIENDWNLFITIYAVMIVIVGVVFFAIIQNKNLIRKKNKAAQYYAASTVKKSAPNTQAKPKKAVTVPANRVRHSEEYMSYYNNIGTMSFEELDKMRDVLFEFYTSVESVKNATGLMSAYGGMKVTDETVRRNKEQLLERRQKEIRSRPYGCRTYGEAHDLVEKAHKDKEYWEYLNR